MNFYLFRVLVVFSLHLLELVRPASACAATQPVHPDSFFPKSACVRSKLDRRLPDEFERSGGRLPHAKGVWLWLVLLRFQLSALRLRQCGVGSARLVLQPIQATGGHTIYLHAAPVENRMTSSVEICVSTTGNTITAMNQLGFPVDSFRVVVHIHRQACAASGAAAL